MCLEPRAAHRVTVTGSLHGCGCLHENGFETLMNVKMADEIPNLLADAGLRFGEVVGLREEAFWCGSFAAALRS